MTAPARAPKGLPEPGAPLAHFVSDRPFDPNESEDRIDSMAEATQLRLMWWQFRRHRVAVVSLVFLVLIYASTLISEVLAPYHQDTRNLDYIYAPPQRVHLFDDGRLIGPFVYGRTQSLDMDTMRRVYVEDRTRVQPLRFFCKGDPYRFWGAIPARLHIVCPAEDGQFFLLGTDRLGRDVLSRIIYGARISLTIGVLGVTMSFVLGIVIGGLAGYHGGWFDAATQRVIEVLQSIPSIPLWMALSAALPQHWPAERVYFAITVILSLIGWTWLARQLRGKVLAIREEEFVMAAQLSGAGDAWVVFRHLIPAVFGHIIVIATLAMPGMILAETTLSFLNLGLRPPLISWGVLLQEAQNLESMRHYPWLLTPAVAIALAVLSFNFFGDGLRDAADPYSR
jgi:peptide/nickel transport system permease protein